MNKKIKIVVYGGAFSPPHVGHAMVIEAVGRLFPCDEIWLMPTSDRTDKKMTAIGTHRMKMLEIMRNELFSDSRIPIKLDSLELDRNKLTTTYDTKKELEEKYPNHEFYFLIGSDIVYDIESKWDYGKELWHDTNLVVLPRSQDFVLINNPPNVVALRGNFAGVDISSTFVRKLLAEGSTGMPYITKGVAEYIKKEGLFQ